METQARTNEGKITVLLNHAYIMHSRHFFFLGCEVSTTTGYRYSDFYPLGSGTGPGDKQLGFRVMANRDAHIALTTSVLGLNPLYEIVIGASSNNYTGNHYHQS